MIRRSFFLNVAACLTCSALSAGTVPAFSQEEEAAGDLKWLQGEWIVIAEKDGKKELTKAELKELNKRMTVQGNKMTINFVFQKKLGTYDGRFELSATTKPKQFDWTGNKDGGARELVGIYEIDKDLDQIKLCYIRRSKNATGPPRPTSFDSFDEKVGICTTFKRDRQ